MRAKFGSDPTAGSKNLSFKFISRYAEINLANKDNGYILITVVLIIEVKMNRFINL